MKKITDMNGVEIKVGDTQVDRKDLLKIAYEAGKESLKSELERERMRLAACGAAALGYFNGCHDDYKSASLGDVLRLVEKTEILEKKLLKLKQLLLLTDPVVSNTSVESTQIIQWTEFLNSFPDEGEKPKEETVTINISDYLEN